MQWQFLLIPDYALSLHRPYVRRMQDRFADNLSWPYHSIPFVTGLIGLVIGSYLVESYGPLAKTIFPPVCLIVGGFGGLVILGNISDKVRKK